nr:unnamed protein product [Callosobruchus analis]
MEKLIRQRGGVKATLTNFEKYRTNIQTSEKLLDVEIIESQGRINIIEGGPGVVVKSDESVVTRRKYRVGRLLNREVWVLGIYDTTLKRGHIMYVPDRSRQTLKGKIQRFVRPGSEIWIDCWSGYTGLSALGYVHRTVNHSNNFVDPLSGVSANQVEGYWSRLKQFLRRLGAL